MTDDIVRLAVVLVAVAVLVPLVAMAIFMPVGMMGGGGWHDGAHMYGDTAMTGPWIAWLATMAILIGVGYLVYRSILGQDDDDVVQELRRAYARGSLSDEEFEKRRKKLTSDDTD
jgi:putative membrane protein